MSAVTALSSIFLVHKTRKKSDPSHLGRDKPIFLMGPGELMIAGVFGSCMSETWKPGREVLIFIVSTLYPNIGRNQAPNSCADKSIFVMGLGKFMFLGTSLASAHLKTVRQA